MVRSEQVQVNGGTGASGNEMGLALLWIGIVAPVAGFADIIVSMVRVPLPDEYDSVTAIFAPLAATTVGAIVVFAALWFLFALIGRRGFPVSVLTLFVSATIALLSFVVLALFLGVLLPTKLEEDTATRLLKLGVVGLFSVTLWRGGYLLGGDVGRTICSRRRPALLLLAAPYLCALTMLMIWLSAFRMDAPLISKEGLQMVALVGSACVVVLAFFYGWGHHRIGRVAALVPVCVVLLAPLAAALASMRPQGLPGGGTAAGGAEKAVFLITIDSLRADVLSCYGSTRVQTTNMDSVAKDGVVFSTAISASSWTLPSVASFMTGVSPVVHGATSWQKRLPDSFKTLAEYYKEGGYHTVAIGQNPVLDGARNIDQGFDEYRWLSTETRHPGISLGRSIIGFFREHTPESTTEQLTRMAIDRLGLAKQGPTFYWIHYYDPHMPYTPPVRYLSETDAASAFGTTFDGLERVRMGRFGAKQTERDWIRNLYEGEVRFVDDEVGRLLTAIKEMGLYDNATIVISSDHGEEFWEHGGFEHGHSMHQELLNVPLIVKPSGSAGTARVDAPVGIEGLTPTLLDLAGLSYDSTAMTTASFAAYLNNELPESPAGSVSSFGTLYFEKLEAVTAPDFKYIRAVDFDSEKLYDRTRDPLEQTPLNLQENADATEKARQLLNQAHGLGSGSGTAEKENVVMDAATEESLRSLGYID